jgi:hypothetical protein
MKNVTLKRASQLKKRLSLLILLCSSAFVAISTHSLAFQFNPALQPFVPQAKVASPRYPAPDFSLYDLAGTRVNLSDYQGSVVAMMFWTTW